MTSLDYFFFSAFPYVAVIVFLVGTTYRYNKKGFQVTSLSAQFLEGKRGFWGTVPFHWGILMVFLGHMVAFLFPDFIFNCWRHCSNIRMPITPTGSETSRIV